MFFEYIWLAWYGTSAGGFDGPRMVTPLWTMTWSARVSSQLPPRSAARSTSTEPGAIPSTISRVTRIGAFFPGTTRRRNHDVAPGHDLEHHLALPAIERFVLRLRVAALVLRVVDLERDLDEARAEALDLFLDRRPDVVGLDLRAPSRLACAIACSPATPAPTTNTFAAVMVPAAVISIGNMRGR